MTQQSAVASVDDPTVTPVAGEPEDDFESSVSRQHVSEGAALRAVADYSGLDLATPPSPAVLSLLDAAYHHMHSIRPEASPEDYTVYVFSLLRECCIDMQEEEELKISAARYIVDHVPYLSADFVELAPRARALLEQAASEAALDPPDEPFLLMAPVALSEARGLDEDLDFEAIRGRARRMNAELRYRAAKRVVRLAKRLLWTAALAFVAYVTFVMTSG